MIYYLCIIHWGNKKSQPKKFTENKSINTSFVRRINTNKVDTSMTHFFSLIFIVQAIKSDQIISELMKVFKVLLNRFQVD